MNGRQEVHRLKQRLEATLARAPLSTVDLEVQSDFAKYFCILVSGFFENALIALILDVAQNRSAPEIVLFVERQLDYWTNPNSEKIFQLFGNFNPEWRSALENYIVDDKKAAVNSLVALRNKIAHGESVGTSLSQIKSYYITVLDIIDFVANLIGA